MVFKQFLPQQRQRPDYRVISVLVTASCKVKLLDPDIPLYTASDIDKADRLLFRAASRSCDTGHTESSVRSGSLRRSSSHLIGRLRAYRPILHKRLPFHTEDPLFGVI